MAAVTSVAAEMASNISKVVNPIHPYYPLDVEIAGYLANRWGVPTLLGIFFGGLAVIFYTTHVLVKKRNPQMPRRELLTVMWFVLCKGAAIRGGTQRRLIRGHRWIHTLFL